MRSTINKRVFREPDGRPASVLYFGIAVAFLSMCVFITQFLGSEDSFLFPLVMGVGFALQGLAESRSESRRRTAGILRLMAMLVYLCALVAIGFVPEFLW